ncbi:MAG: alpha/beta fold hydrolase [Caldisericaceae bacterium]
MGYIDSSGIKLYYEVYGEGKPLILVGGIAQQICMWKYQIEAFRNDFKVVVFDNRGAGKSEKPDSGYSVDTFAIDVKAIIDSLKLDQPHILGVSFGGFVAQKVAYKYADFIDKLVLVNTAFGGPKYVPPSMDVINNMIYGASGDNPLEKGVNSLSLSFTKEYFEQHKTEIEELVRCLLENPQPSYAYNGQVMAGASFNMEEESKHIKNETLVLTAMNDRVVPEENGIMLSKNIPNSKLVQIPNAGHLSFIEQSELFNKVVRDFLR